MCPEGTTAEALRESDFSLASQCLEPKWQQTTTSDLTAILAYCRSRWSSNRTDKAYTKMGPHARHNHTPRDGSSVCEGAVGSASCTTRPLGAQVVSITREVHTRRRRAYALASRLYKRVGIPAAQLQCRPPLKRLAKTLHTGPSINTCTQPRRRTTTHTLRTVQLTSDRALLPAGSDVVCCHIFRCAMPCCNSSDIENHLVATTIML